MISRAMCSVHNGLRDVLPEPEGPIMTFKTPGSNVVLIGFKIMMLSRFLRVKSRFCIAKSKPSRVMLTVLEFGTDDVSLS